MYGIHDMCFIPFFFFFEEVEQKHSKIKQLVSTI